jgi:glycosyltransferase involved in cell wall biosynthesis
MARGLVQAGLDVHIATTDDHGPGHLDVPLGQPVLQDGVTHWYFRRQISFYICSWPLTRWLAQHARKYDLVHIHYLFTSTSVIAAVAAATWRVPYVVRPLGVLNRWGIYKRRPLMKKLSLRFVEHHILAHAARVQFTSAQERLEAEELAISMASTVLPLGIDLAPFTHLPPPGTFRQQYPDLAGKTLLLFLSRLDVKKGLDLLLPAFAQLKQIQPDVALVLAGSGTPEFEAGLHAQVQALGIERDVIFTGFLEGTQKSAALADCDLFVLPSYSENFGVVVVEAMASGLPVVISDQIGLSPDIQQAQAGIVVPCQQDKLVEALHNLVSDAEQRRQFADRARHLAQQRFALDTATNSLIQLYTDVLIDASKPHT